MTKKELAEKLNGRQYGDSFEDVMEEAKQSGFVIVTGASDDLMEFAGAFRDEGGCFDGGRVYFDRSGVDQEGEERANWIDAKWCDGVNRNGILATWVMRRIFLANGLIFLSNRISIVRVWCFLLRI